MYVMSIPETTYNDSGLSGSSAYYYIVTAVNAVALDHSVLRGSAPGSWGSRHAPGATAGNTSRSC